MTIPCVVTTRDRSGNLKLLYCTKTYRGAKRIKKRIECVYDYPVVIYEVWNYAIAVQIVGYINDDPMDDRTVKAARG